MRDILHTRSMEDTARLLASRHERVLIRARTVLWNPIRFRRSEIEDLTPYLVQHKPEFDVFLARWNREGGLLIYDRTYQKTENIAAHHAQLVVECPFNVETLKDFLEGARNVGVVYRPPNWNEHVKCVRDLFPPAETCKRFYDYCSTGGTHHALARLLKLTEPLTVRSDEAICDALGINRNQMNVIRDACLRPRDYKSVIQVVPRVEPEAEELVPVYNWILGNCEEIAGVRFIVGSSLSKATRYWKVALRALVRSGSVERKETLGLYFLSGLPPDWESIQAEHDAAQDRLRAVIRQVEATKEYS